MEISIQTHTKIMGGKVGERTAKKASCHSIIQVGYKGGSPVRYFICVRLLLFLSILWPHSYGVVAREANVTEEGFILFKKNAFYLFLLGKAALE